MRIEASAPGKIILCGEHAVVHGTKAIAAAINKVTTVRIAPSSLDVTLHICKPFPETNLNIELSELDKLVQWLRLEHTDSSSDGFYGIASDLLGKLVEKIGEIASLEEVSKVDEKFKGAVKSSVVVFIYFYVLMVYAFKCTLKSCSVEIESELPLGAGLGSSASYCTALVGALSRFLKTDNALSSDELNKWSFQGEKLLHGTPSGVDNTVSVFGGAIVYQKDIAKGTSSMRPIQMNVRIRILVVNTKVPRNTKTLVAGVRSLLEANPDEIRAKFAEIDRIAAQFENLVAGEDDSLLKIGELFKRNQVLLHELGVGHARISEALEVLEILAIPGKLTGAGGGGCLFGLLSALGEHDSESVIKEAIEKLENNGFEVFEAEIGCKGVHIKESR